MKPGACVGAWFDRRNTNTDVHQGLLGGLRRWIWEFSLKRLATLDDFIQRVAELSQPGNRYNDCVLATTDFLNDSEELTALVFAQVKRKSFALDP